MIETGICILCKNECILQYALVNLKMTVEEKPFVVCFYCAKKLVTQKEKEDE